MGKAKKLFMNARVIILLVSLLLAVVAIHPNLGVEGVAIRSVVDNSSADLAGMDSPSPQSTPMSREVIVAINSVPIKNLQDYYEAVSDLVVNQTVTIKTNQADGYYQLKVKPLIERIDTNTTKEKTIQETYQVNETINGTVVLVNKTRNKTVDVPVYEKNIIGVQDIGLRVYDAPTSNVRKGLDLQGGTRVLLKPDEPISQDDMDLLLENMRQRLNIYQLSDIVVKEAGDLSGNQYVVVEIAGASEEEVKGLISKQGKFEAKIGNDTVFRGGEKDITYVCRSPDCSGIDPRPGRGCGQVSEGQWACHYYFSIELRPEAADKQAAATDKLSVVTVDEEGNVLPIGSQYLNDTIDFYLDDFKTNSLNIDASLKGRPSTRIEITGTATGVNEQDAYDEAKQKLKEMQTIILSGSLPVSLTVVKTDLLSPSIGEQFMANAWLVGLFAILGVAVVIFIRYRKIQVAAPMLITMLSEVVLILGFGALFKWNLDLAGIAGIIIAVGTGVDDQIIIADETMKGEESSRGWKDRLKRAFFIIMGAYFTTVVAMLPLLAAGAGLLRGFAIVTIAGVTFGVFITRPAYAKIVETLLKE